MMIGVIPMLPEGTRVDAAANKKVYVKVTAMYSYAYEVLDKVNEKRAAAGLDPLVMDKLLLADAMQRAADQVITVAATGGLSHTTNYGERYLDTQDRSYGENIAAGQSTPEEVMEDWMNSSGHRANILREGYTCIGIGCVKCGAGYYVYWAQEFGYCDPETTVKPVDTAKNFAVEVSDDVYSSLQNLSASYNSVISFTDPGPATAAGWKKESAGWRYYQADGTAAVGWLKVGNAWYLLDAAGIMVTGWSRVGGQYYYFATSGAMVTGWRLISGTWYYFAGGGAMATGWKKIGGAWYYFTGGGAMVIGWKKIGGVWYYFQNGGAMKTGWLNQGGKWYFLNGSGAMVTQSREIGGKMYFFNASGVCLNP